MPSAPVGFHPEAIVEVAAALKWYQERSDAAAAAFLAELDRAVESIAEAPGRVQGGGGDGRCLLPGPDAPCRRDRPAGDTEPPGKSHQAGVREAVVSLSCEAKVNEGTTVTGSEAWPNDQEAGRQDSYLLKGVPLYEGVDPLLLVT